MPGYKAHVAGAVAVSGAVMAGAWWLGYFRPDMPKALMLIAISALAGLFPDVDTSSKGRHIYYLGVALVDMWLIIREQYRYAAILGFCALMPAIGSHRGWTHTWWAMLVVPSPVVLLPFTLFKIPWQICLPYYIACVIGYFSHLLLDRKF